MPALGQTNEGLGLTDPQPAGGVLVVKEAKHVKRFKEPSALPAPYRALKEREARTLRQ